MFWFQWDVKVLLICLSLSFFQQQKNIQLFTFWYLSIKRQCFCHVVIVDACWFAALNCKWKHVWIKLSICFSFARETFRFHSEVKLFTFWYLSIKRECFYHVVMNNARAVQNFQVKRISLAGEFVSCLFRMTFQT